MNILTVLIIYGGSVLLSFPFLLKDAKEYDNIIIPKVAATILSMLPVINLWISVPLMLKWIALKVLVFRLRRLAKRSDVPGNEQVMNTVADLLKETNKIDVE